MEKDLKSLVIIFKAQTSLALSVKKSLENTGLNMNEFVAMEALYIKNKLTTQQLVDSVLIPNSSMTYVLDILRDKGYITRERCTTDRRIQYVELSLEGKAAFEKVYQKHSEYSRDILDVMDPEEEKIMQEALKKVGKKALERNTK
ncbi:MAG: MarR family transcriptional regulator [Erysipelothrix sp.]|nr:MarR family transcriptional regulator [Erysipelothrix sp.]